MSSSGEATRGGDFVIVQTDPGTIQGIAEPFRTKKFTLTSSTNVNLVDEDGHPVGLAATDQYNQLRLAAQARRLARLVLCALFG